jgi:5S rRNA maturation endonuclease (ribonuclease M5)
MNPQEHLEALEAFFEELREENLKTPILVEGPHDIEALRALGLKGTLLSLHGPRSLIDEADAIAQTYDALILLTDWDRTGGSLARRLSNHLKGRVKIDLDLRRRLARLVQVPCVEDVPAFHQTLKREAAPR